MQATSVRNIFPHLVFSTLLVKKIDEMEITITDDTHVPENVTPINKFNGIGPDVSIPCNMILDEDDLEVSISDEMSTTDDENHNEWQTVVKKSTAQQIARKLYHNNGS